MKKNKKKREDQSALQKFRGALRQIVSPGTADAEPDYVLSEILELLERQKETVFSKGGNSKSDIEVLVAYEELMGFVIKLLSEMGTSLWRLKQKMVKPGTDEPLDEMRRAFRHFESTWDTLIQAGVEIQDHTGNPVPEGGVYELHAIAYETTPGLTREQVIETVKPSIYFKGQRIQMGEVIVGTP